MAVNIKPIRRLIKVTQTQLAEKCGWEDAQSRISNYENGIREPSLQDMRRIVAALQELGAECSLDSVFPPEAA